ncbi:MAG: hypothetical protein ABR595_05385 [Psychroflexus sp.]
MFACADDNPDVIDSNDSVEKSIDINYENAFDNSIGYTNSDNNEFTEINQNQLTNYWINTLELDENIEFETVELIKAEVEEDEEQYYMLNSTSREGNINISSKVLLSSNQSFLLTSEICKCESTNSNFGCEVKDMCSCSSKPRQGTCKKTHTLSRDVKADFFRL